MSMNEEEEKKKQGFCRETTNEPAFPGCRTKVKRKQLLTSLAHDKKEPFSSEG